jgi:2-isopropylmalate synthase
MGYELTDENLSEVFNRFKRVADKKKNVTEADLQALVKDELYQPREIFHLEDMQVVCGTLGMPTATVRMRGPDGASVVRAAMGTGPVDACYKAIDEIMCLPNKLLEYNLHAVTEGIDALGEVSVRIQVDARDTSAPQRISAQHEQVGHRIFGGHGASTDTIVAGARAYVNAINKAMAALGMYSDQQVPAAARTPAAGPAA